LLPILPPPFSLLRSLRLRLMPLCAWLWSPESWPLSLWVLLNCILLVSCHQQEKPVSLKLTASSFSNLPGWEQDDLTAFSAAFNRSCQRIANQPPYRAFGILAAAGTIAQWQSLCAEFSHINHLNTAQLRAFIEARFQPHLITAGDQETGLFTGYYEASLNGSRTPQPTFPVPLHKRPEDLVLVQLGDFRDSLKGERIAGRVVNQRLRPYENRASIIDPQWPHYGHALVWVDDPIDAFFVQIQGSGLVQMDDGSLMRVGYDGHNGHVYYAIGRELIKRGELSQDEVSMQSIRGWLEANPEQADAIMNTNPSYIFFREVHGEGPIGAEGIALTAERSLAVDRTLLPYGLPLWVDIEAPKAGLEPIRKLMVAQDTGGAIRGPVRGDVFWGYGQVAEDMAGHMRSQGRYWALLPK